MPNDDAVEKGGWGGENVSKSDDVILGCSLTAQNVGKTGFRNYHFDGKLC